MGEPHRELLADGEAQGVEAHSDVVLSEQPGVAAGHGRRRQRAVLRRGDRRVTGTRRQRRCGAPVAADQFDRRGAADGGRVPGPASEVGQGLPLILAILLLRSEVGHLELRAAPHQVAAQRLRVREAQVAAEEAAAESALVVQVVERDLIEEAIGAHRGRRPEIAQASALPPGLRRSMPRAELRGGQCRFAREPLAGADTAAAGNHDHAGHFGAELRRDVASPQLRGLDEAAVEGVGERSRQLVADRQTVDDERHLVVGPPRVDGAIGVLRKPWKRDEHGLHAAAADRRGQLLDPDEAHLGARASQCRVHQLRFGRDAHDRGLRRHAQHEGQLHRDAGAQRHRCDVRFEAGDLRPHLVAIEREVGPFEGAVGPGHGVARQPGQGARQMDVDARHHTAQFVGDKSLDRRRALGPGGPGQGQRQKETEKPRQTKHFE